MGKNNRERRAAKAKAKAKADARNRVGQHGRGRAQAAGPSHHASAGSLPPPDAAELAEKLLRVIVFTKVDDGLPRAAELHRLSLLPAATVNRVVEQVLVRQVGTVWGGGWQPGEVTRHARLNEAAPVRRLVELAVAVDHAQRRSATLDHRWTEHVEALDLPAVNGRGGWFARWIDDENLARAKGIDTSAEALSLLVSLPHLEPIMPPPGSKGVSSRPQASAWSGAAGADADPVLERIRNLLAKAESSGFEAEAATFTAKAHELMTRYAIDVALVHGADPSARPIRIRIPIDPPYVDAKSLLLQQIAEAGRCRAVQHAGLDLSTVVGFPDDVTGVEMLFTSLLVQAQAALADAAKRAPAGTRTRSQSFRSAFLLAFANRIAERLEDVNASVYADVESEQGGSFLPVLAARSGAVDDVFDEAFGELVSSPVRGGWDSAGWAGGRIAADNAKLNDEVAS